MMELLQNIYEQCLSDPNVDGLTQAPLKMFLFVVAVLASLYPAF